MQYCTSISIPTLLYLHLVHTLYIYTHSISILLYLQYPLSCTVLMQHRHARSPAHNLIANNDIWPKADTSHASSVSSDAVLEASQQIRAHQSASF